MFAQSWASQSQSYLQSIIFPSLAFFIVKNRKIKISQFERGVSRSFRRFRVKHRCRTKQLQLIRTLTAPKLNSELKQPEQRESEHTDRKGGGAARVQVHVLLHCIDNNIKAKKNEKISNKTYIA